MLALLLISILIGSAFYAGYVSAPIGTTFTISQGVYPMASYTIWLEGSTYYAKNDMGAIPSWASTTNASNLLENVISQNGLHVHFTSGTFEFTNNFQILYSNIKVTGEGIGTTILKQKDNANLGDKGAGNRDLALLQIGIDIADNRVSTSNILIEDLTVDFNQAGQTTTYYSRLQEGLGGPTGIGIYADGVEGLRVNRVKVVDAYSIGIWIYGGTGTPNYPTVNNIVENSIVDYGTSNSTIGIMTSSNFHLDTKILNNYVSVNSAQLEGIRLEEGHTSIVTGNHVTNPNAQGYGITVRELSAGSPFNRSANIISENIVNKTGWSGIEIFSSQNNIVSDNIILNATTQGIGVFTSSGKSSNGNQIIGNEIINSKRGIRLYGSGGTNYTLVSLNALKGIGSEYCFLEESGSNWNLITMNDFTENPDASYLVAINGANTRVNHNQGFITENSGSASVATGNTVNHGLSGTPTSVILTITVSEDVWVSALGVTSFTVNYDGGGTQTVYWYAEYKL